MPPVYTPPGQYTPPTEPPPSTDWGSQVSQGALKYLSNGIGSLMGAVTNPNAFAANAGMALGQQAAANLGMGLTNPQSPVTQQVFGQSPMLPGSSAMPPPKTFGAVGDVVGTPTVGGSNMPPKYNPLSPFVDWYNNNQSPDLPGPSPVQQLASSSAWGILNDPNGAGLSLHNQLFGGGAGSNAGGAINGWSARQFGTGAPSVQSVQSTQYNPLGGGSANTGALVRPVTTPPVTPPAGGGGTSGAAQAAAAAASYGNLSAQAREWEQIKPMADRMGIGIERLVGVYMNPNDPNAKTDLRGALSEAIADDVWGKAAQAAGLFTGDPAADQRLWEEHYYAKTRGARDPLEGHPMGVQMIQAAAKDLASQNQQAAFQTYSDLINSGLI